MKDERKFWRVTSDDYHLDTSDYLEHGYEMECFYRDALRRLVEHWKGRTGESVDERHEFLYLRFHDTPGGNPDEAWLPRILLEPVPVPDYMIRREPNPQDEIIAELDEAFGFD